MIILSWHVPYKQNQEGLKESSGKSLGLRGLIPLLSHVRTCDC
jgi:hypothetical protein